MSTDVEWERWGRRDPYFGVITSEIYRGRQLTPEARAQFFASGEHHVKGVLDTCRRLFDPGFVPRRVLDFGCGVGRLTVHFARAGEHVVGVDVSRAMLDEAVRNRDEHRVDNVTFELSDDTLSLVNGDFDLVHSAITLQHIEVARGRLLFTRLLDKLAPGGIGAIQMTYAKAHHAETFGQPPAPRRAVPAPLQLAIGTLSRLLRRGDKAEDLLDQTAPASRSGSDPEMQMNPYPLSDMAYLMQCAGIRHFHAEFTDHGGELGVFLYFQKPTTRELAC